MGITPQLLPAIISITLSKGSRIMAEEGVIVRRSHNVIENFGSMDILCTDKTGTLTEGIIALGGACDTYGEKSDEVFRLAYINASLQTGMDNSLDRAISEAGNPSVSRASRRGEIPFDFTRERLSVIAEDGELNLITKGALSRVLDVCAYIKDKGEIISRDEAGMERIDKLYESWSRSGIRALGVAVRKVEPKEKYYVDDEKDMVFMGFLLMFDHPKEGIFQTVSDLRDNGVSLKVITGDNCLIAVHTMESVGLEVTGVITGRELMKLSEESLWNRIESVNVFAEVDPNQKERIILALKKNHHVVGYMGDGINDVPALHAADVSISVDNAVDVARESADFVLIEKASVR